MSTLLDSNPLPDSRQTNSVIVYHAGQNDVELQLDAVHRTIWTTQRQIAQLLDLDVRTVNHHILKFKEQRGDAAVKGIRKFEIPTNGGQQAVEHYDMTVVTYVGFRAQATDRTMQFQDWVGEMLDKALSPKQLSPAEMLLASAQQLVDHERRLLEVEQRVEQLHTAQLALSGGENFYTIKGYFHVKKLGAIDHTTAQRWGFKAAKLSRAKGVQIGKAFDPLYGEINTYAESVLVELIGGAR